MISYDRNNISYHISSNNKKYFFKIIININSKNHGNNFTKYEMI